MFIVLTIQNFHNFIGHSIALPDKHMLIINQVLELRDNYIIEVVLYSDAIFNGLRRLYINRCSYGDGSKTYKVTNGNYIGAVVEDTLSDMQKLIEWIKSFMQLC